MNKDLLALIATVLGAGGGGAVVIGAIRDYFNRRRSSPSQSDANVLSVGLARDQLEKDNERLRQERAEDHARHERERAEWARTRAEDRSEIDALERKVRELLDELIALRTRHDDATR